MQAHRHGGNLERRIAFQRLVSSVQLQPRAVFMNYRPHSRIRNRPVTEPLSPGRAARHTLVDSDSLFSPDYVTARYRIREAAARLECEIQAHPIDGKGPHGEDLTVDVVMTRATDADRTLVLSSGIHGVEGFFGSAVQLGVLEEWIRGNGPPPGVRCVLLHALNPFGFAWRRRVNEANVDLNRNLLGDGEAFAGSPEGYGRLDSLLNPPRPPSRWEPVTLKMLAAIARYGMPALKQAVAAGQYDYPRGLFYGGDRPSRVSEVLAANFDEWLGESRQVMHLDFHTGLGDRAICRLLIDTPLTEDDHRRLSAWFGPDSFEVAHSHGVAYTARGTFGRWCAGRSRRVDYLYATAEFGTYSPIEIVAGLRAENQAHHWGRLEDASTERAKQRLVELFCPRSEGWRRRVLERGRELVAQAIRGLST